MKKTSLALVMFYDAVIIDKMYFVHRNVNWVLQNYTC